MFIRYAGCAGLFLAASLVLPCRAQTPTPVPTVAETIYQNAIQTMLRAPLPPYAQYDITIDSPGEELALLRHHGPFLDIGENGPSHITSDAVIRNSDGLTAVKLDDGTYDATYYAAFFGATWSAVHDWLRFGGEDAANDGSSSQAGGAAGLHVIAVVSSLDPGAYIVTDRGAAQCPSGSPGHMVHLYARFDTERHPLTDAVVDTHTSMFCMMRFSIAPRHLLCTHLCNGTVELHFGSVDDYSVISDASVKIAWPSLGAAPAGAVLLDFRYSDFSFPRTVSTKLLDKPSVN